MTEGFLIGGGLLVVGLLLQLVTGPVKWSLFAWPVNLIVFIVFLLVIVLMYLLRRKVYVFGWMMHLQAAVPALCFALILTIVMGLIPQTRGNDGPWLSRMLSFWPLVLSYVWVCLISGLTTLNHLKRFSWKEIPFLLNHLGVFLAIVSATLGHADMKQLQMTAYYDTPEWRAIDSEGKEYEPGLAIVLHEFSVDYYEDMTPRRFASDISVYTEDQKSLRGVVEVNKPLMVNGWKIYQYGYDTARGNRSNYSVFSLVRDPWLPLVYAGIFMMLAGAVCLFLFMAPKPRKKEEML